VIRPTSRPTLRQTGSRDVGTPGDSSLTSQTGTSVSPPGRTKGMVNRLNQTIKKKNVLPSD